MSNLHPLQLLLRKLEAHARLGEADRAAILGLPSTLRAIDPTGYILREGDRPEACAVLVMGFAVRQKVTGDGARQILSLHVPGDPLDFQNLYLEEADHSLQALGRCQVAFIPRAAVHELIASHPAAARAILHYTLVEASIFREWILNIGRRSAAARVAHVMCELAVRLEAQGLATRQRFDLPTTQEQLADVAGLTSVHVNRTLKALEAEGVIRRRGRRVEVPDWATLRDRADFNERYLHSSVEYGARRRTAA